jgi:serine phosphatase RsbU (regulator of sigma subunit)
VSLASANEFVLRPHAIPFALLAAGVLVMAIVVMLRRGDLPIRAGFIGVGVLGFTWAMGSAVTQCSTSEPLAELFTRIVAGAFSFIGPALLLLFLALCGILTQLRRLLYGFGALAVIVCVVTWTTDLVVAGVWKSAWGTWLPVGGPLQPLHFVILALPVVVGVFLVHRVRHEHRTQPYRRYLTVVTVAMLVGLVDVMVNYRVGVYLFSVVPALVAVGYTLWALFHTDLLYARGRGVDGGAVWELILVALLVPLVALAAWVASRYGADGSPWLAILLLVPLYGAMQAIVLIVRSYVVRDENPVLDSDAEQELEEFGELVKEPRNEAVVGELLAELLDQHGHLSDTALYVVKEQGGWRQAITGEPRLVAAPAAVERWLREQRRLVQRRELLIRRLGKLREALLEIFDRLAADVLIPLVERGRLVGVIAGKLPPDTRELHARELHLLRRAGRTAARALIYVDLFRDAMERLEMAREFEVAATSRVTREPGEQRQLYELCEVIGYHHATRQVSGHFWTSYELDDGRVLVVMGDVADHGMPTALVAATVSGACETVLRVRGTDVDLVELMALLDRAVRSVGGERRYDMGCFAAVFAGNRVTYASAGHPAPWVCRRPENGGREDDLRALETSGPRLGSASTGVTAEIMRVASAELQWNDIVVICSESLVAMPGGDGEGYGERRLPRLLRRQARAAGGRLCRVVMDDLATHAGDEPLSEDASMVVVRMGGGSSRRRARTTGVRPSSSDDPADSG